MHLDEEGLKHRTSLRRLRANLQVPVYAVKPQVLHRNASRGAYTNERPKGPSWRGEENAVSVINQRPIRVHQINV